MSDSCLNGFFNDSELVEQTSLVNIGPVGYRGRQQILFPDIRFTCNGFITKWIVGAQVRNDSEGHRMPELQIWRLNSGTNDTYTKINSSLITPNEIQGSPNVHEFIPSTPLQFTDGDILGVHQPEFMPSRFVLFQQRNTGPENYNRFRSNPQSTFTISSSASLYDYPLVSVEGKILYVSW